MRIPNLLKSFTITAVIAVIVTIVAEVPDFDLAGIASFMFIWTVIHSLFFRKHSDETMA